MYSVHYIFTVCRHIYFLCHLCVLQLLLIGLSNRQSNTYRSQNTCIRPRSLEWNCKIYKWTIGVKVLLPSSGQMGRVERNLWIIAREIVHNLSKCIDLCLLLYLCFFTCSSHVKENCLGGTRNWCSQLLGFFFYGVFLNQQGRIVHKRGILGQNKNKNDS